MTPEKWQQIKRLVNSEGRLGPIQQGRFRQERSEDGECQIRFLDGRSG